MKTEDEITTQLETLLRDFQGREYSGEMGPETLFFADLGFVSIDAVVLGERLEEIFGQRIPFNKFVAEAAARDAEDIQLGELVQFLATHLQ